MAVGMTIDVASIDMVSEVNMVSADYIFFYFLLVTRNFAVTAIPFTMTVFLLTVTSDERLVIKMEAKCSQNSLNLKY